jgi:serine/threonine protein kinase
MAVPTTIDDFLDVARKSQQIDNTRLDEFLQQRSDVPSEPKKLAALLIRKGLLTTFQAQQFLLGKHKGFTLGDYRVIERLGSGGTGMVYLAEHQVMKRRVALKVLPTPYAEDPALLERFRLEAQAAAALDHPNVVHVYDFRKEGPIYFIVMEYIDGPSLQQMLNRRGALSIGTACEYARQAALGLQHAHERGMVHRDVKPANLLVDSSETVKVLDLGLARYDVEGSESQVTEKFNSNTVLGTADYLSPEQALNLHDVDGRADLYSLGATLYALLAGKPPFHKGSIGQKLMWHQTKDPDPVTVHRPETPEELAALVAKMLAKKPEDRPSSAEEVAETLAAWAEAPQPAVKPARTMLEIRLPSPSSSSRSGRLAPTVEPDTTVLAHEDTAKIRPEEKKKESKKRAEKRAKGTPRPKQLWLLLALAAAVGGAAVGLVSFLLARG